MEDPVHASDDYRDKLRALEQELRSGRPVQTRNWLPIIAAVLVVLGITGLASWSFSSAGFFAFKSVAGPQGPRGLPGPPGPPGPAGSASTGIRVAEFGCNAASCLLSCNNDERIVNAYSLSPGGAFTFEDDRSVTFRPLRRPSNKIVLVCFMPQ